MAKQILYGTEAKASIKSGIDAVANAVKVTLGPKGQNVFIDSEYGEEGRVTKDGVTVAKSITLPDKLQDAGAKIIKKVASKTADDAGDGTTSATVIAQAIIAEGNKLIASGANPMELKKGIQLAINMATESFKNHAVEVDGVSDLIKVATVSANGDTFIGEIIGDAINTVGPDGVVTVETSKNLDTYIEKVQGLRFDRGYKSPYFQTNIAKGECVLENPVILLTTQKINTIKQIEKFLVMCNQQSRPILIVCDGCEGEAFNLLVVNKLRGTIQCCVVGCPSFGDRREAELEDIAKVVGAVVVNPAVNGNLEAADVRVMGEAEKVIVTSKTTTIVSGKGSEEEINNRIADIKLKIDEESSKYNKDILRQRLAKLTGGVAILYVGAMSEVELNEKKDRIDDALCATRAAREEGILPGGAIAYLNAALEIEHSLDGMQKDDKVAGMQLVAEALKAPLAQIVENGYGPGKGVVAVAQLTGAKTQDRVDAGSFKPYTYGIDATDYKYVDMIEAGIIDPAKVCRTAVENAGSIAGMYLTTGAIVIDLEEKKKEDTK